MARLCLLLPMLTMGAGAAAAPPSVAELEQQVRATERAFAATMRQRDFAAFTRFLSEEAVFSGGAQPLRGKQAVADAWQRYFAQPDAPFSWEPDRVTVLESGTLATTTGPVYDPAGKLVARFNSVWRQEAPGVWRIVLDGGSDLADCKK